MTLPVVQLDEWRSAASRDAKCECGSVWFTLVRERDGEETAGAVTMDVDGHIWGYAGTPRCVECGNDYKP